MQYAAMLRPNEFRDFPMAHTFKGLQRKSRPGQSGPENLGSATQPRLDTMVFFEEDLWWNSTLNTLRGKKNGHWGGKYWGYCFTFSDLALGTSMDHALQHQHLGNAAGGVTEPLGLSVVWGRIMIHIQQRGPQLFVQIIYTWTNWTGWFL